MIILKDLKRSSHIDQNITKKIYQKIENQPEQRGRPKKNKEK
jgi:hypothetical protein